jgi:Fe-S-cluster containining protein
MIDEIPPRCKRCGTCCCKGGPALHLQDLSLVRKGLVKHGDLITIRKGELVQDPLKMKLRPVSTELVKINGQGDTWSCRFYDPAAFSCNIHGRHPVECQFLDCSNPEKIARIIEKDTICRADLINPGDPIISIIEKHEQKCPLDELTAIAKRRMEGLSISLLELESLSIAATQDLVFRNEAISDGMAAMHELFILGRPLFLLLKMAGFAIVEKKQGVEVKIR